MTNTALTLAILTTVAWGVWSLLIKLATRSLQPEAAMVISYLTAVAVAITYVFAAGIGFSPTLVGSGYAVLGGFFAGIGAIAFYAALAHGQAAIVTPVSGLYFVVAAILGVVVLGESVQLRQVAGLSFAGVAVVLLGW